jgi:hypothetical protein
MKTKIIFTALTLMLSASLALGQVTYDAKTSFGVLGGINFQNLNGKDASGDNLDYDMIIGYHVGLNVQIPLVPEFYFQPGLLFTTKGAKNTTGSVTSTYNISYLEMPLNFVYKGRLGNGYIILGFGPYVGYALMGKAKHEGGELSFERNIEFTNTVEVGDPLTTTYFKPLDLGGNLFFGYEMASGMFFQLNTQLGMLTINPEDKRFPANDLAVKNTGFGFSLGYRF